MKFKRLMPPAIAFVAILTTLAACATNTRAINAFCMLYDPVYTSKKDTEETRAQVDDNNATYEALRCPAKPIK